MRLQSNFLETLREYEMQPPQFLQELVLESTIYSNIFCAEEIKQAEISPPPSLLTSIEKELGLFNTPARSNLFWIGDISMMKRISAAAAILALITTVIIHTNPDQRKGPSIFVKQDKKASEIVPESSSVSIQKIKPAITKISMGRRKIAQPKFTPQLNAESSTLAYMPSEGDLWVKLVSFQTNSGGLETWINTVGEKRITIDEYSTLQVSDKIVKMIKALRETKANGKPTRKAIKTKRRMEKWKVKDEHYFSEDKSALDPIDLGKLLFNNY